MQVQAKHLKLGDMVHLGFESFGTAIVTQITQSTVTLFRPYATHSDFSCASGVIPYIGVEIFDVTRDEKLFNRVRESLLPASEHERELRA